MINNHKILKNLTFRAYRTRVLGLFFLILFLACPDPANIKKYTVNFDPMGGTGGPISLSISSMLPFSEPTNKPIKSPKITASETATYYFGGWYTSGIELEQDGTTKYQFGSILSNDLDLYARWYTSQPADKAALQDLLNQASSRTSSNPDALNLIDVRQVTDMSALMDGLTATSTFNYDISRWDTSAVTNMNEMFKGATAFDQDLTAWADKAGRDTTNMFAGATLPNDQRAAWMPKAPFKVIFDARGGTGGPTSLSINSGTPLMEPSAKPSRTTYYFGGWYTSGIELEQDGTTKYQFGSSLSNDLNLYARWYTSQPADKAALQALLNQASSRTSSNPDALNLIDVRQVTDMRLLMDGLGATFDYDISRWDTSAVTNMNEMFKGAAAFNQDLTAWADKAGRDTTNMLAGATLPNSKRAAWMPGLDLYEVIFDARGGTGGPVSLRVGIGNPLIEPSAKPSRATYYFGGWYTSSTELEQDGTTKYKFGSSLNADLNLYARWYTSQPENKAALQALLNQASSLTSSNSDALNLIDVRQIRDMELLMDGLGASFNYDISRWDTAAVTSMRKMFQGATAFNRDLEKWDTSAVTDMSWMFYDAIRFNGNIGSWNTAAVTDMSRMFTDARAFNRDLDKWNTSAVTSMSQMFFAATVFNGNIGGWKTGAVKDMSQMFIHTKSFNRDLNWDTSAVKDMSQMFFAATAFNGNIDAWKTGAVTDMSQMFVGALAFNRNIGSWNTAAVTDMSRMFDGATAFNGNIGSWKTAKVTNMGSMFQDASSFNRDLRWDTSAVTNMVKMFSGATVFNGDIASWETGSVSSMNEMFKGAVAFNADIGSWKTGTVINMGSMFQDASSFNRDLRWDTSAVIDMSWMFASASSFNGNISAWNTGAVTVMTNMFSKARAFNQDLRTWVRNERLDTSYMFDGADSMPNSKRASWMPMAP